MGTKIRSPITNIVIIVLALFGIVVPNGAETLDLFMKGVIPTWPNAYLCTSLTVADGLAHIYKFEPIANASTVHHIIVYTCDGPAASGAANWKCPATCSRGVRESIVYAWAKNAPATVLPQDVGFRIGKNTAMKTLVLQVHYAKVLSVPDYSGVRLHITKESPKNVAGIFFMGATSFQIPKGYPSYRVDISCNYSLKNNLTLFAVRGHTHNLGVVVSGYHNNATGTNSILKVNPQFPQTFYPVESNIIVKPGDNLLARCTYNSTTATKAVGVGPTGEMCNYYIMYYTDSSAQNTYLQCTGNYLKNLTGDRYPPDGSVPLPPNPYLEEVAKGIEHNSTMSERSVRSVRSQPEASETILMPGAKPKMQDAYLCTAHHLKEEEYYINKFEALANADTAHHMLLYGCDGEPYSSEDMWPCPLMCRNGPSTILFAWAKNAPPTALPKDVGLRIGSKTSIKTLVLQVHYARTFADNENPDRSGLKIYTTYDKPKYVAGIFLLLSSSFKIPPGEQLYPVDISCKFNWHTSIFPFAYRTHAHALGKVLTGYQHNGTYNVIGKGNPQWPQAFYPVQKPIEVKPGDYLAARCTYDSTSMSHPVGVGSTGNDEMCNFYIMFYTDSSVADPSGECFANEYPRLTGDNFPKDVSVPLPPNPDLEEVAKGGHHHAGMTPNQQADDNGNSFNDTKTYEILMPGAKPSKPDAYLCTAFTVPDDEFYIYKFEALANAATVHHMLIFGCDGEAGSTEPISDCSAMCGRGMSVILFAWAKNAPPTVLPNGVGLRAGRKTSVQTIIIQIHYAKAFADSEPADHSGLRLYTTHHKPQFVAGVYLLSAGFTIPPGKESYPVDISCSYTDENSIFPFAYRTHAHGLGRVITGYQHNGTYHQIGKGNPQWPQAFYPVKDFIEVKRGDSLAARCTYDSRSMSQPVGVGSTGNDEMCNFYIMFYTDSNVKYPTGGCGRNELPHLTGEHFPSDVSVPLPPNPDLEDKALGAHHHGAMGQNHQDDETSIPDTKTKEILMPGAKPTTSDAYLCTGLPVTEDEYYIYKFEALANADTAHHMLLYGCDDEPHSTDPIWNCPQMCKNGQSTILFAWAKNAPPTVLPKGVGLRVGSKTTIKTIVLQVHYAKTFEVSEPADHSGLKIYTTNEKPQFVAGIFLLAAGWFKIPPGENSYPVDISCTFSKDKSIFPFAYRTHAHGLGKVITGYQHNGTYHEIGKGNPQWPQAFYPVKDFIEVKPGDSLAARCTYDSTSMTKPVGVGSTGNDEMCNFYIMFYTDSSVADPSGSCGFNALPGLTGENFPSDVSVALPPNPVLEDEAKGVHHHGGMNQNHQDEVYYKDTKILNILMRGAKPKTSDAYLCTAYPAEDLESYIYKFEAAAEASTAHHMLLYGCDGEEYSKEPIWNCPAMCKSGHPIILFAWAKNAPPTVFPKDVGLRIGSRTLIKTLVLQVHYARTFSDNEPEDHSGLKVYTTQTKQRYVAGIFFLGSSDFTVPNGFPSYPVDVSCRFTKDKSIFPFAYRTHAHGLGRVITGYQYNGSYHEIGKGNPQWPQTFYPVHDKIEVKTGDYLLARCTYDSTSMTHSVKVGSTGNDEMCNFYIMFYTDSSVADPYGECYRDSVPNLTGDSFPADVSVTLPPNPALEDEAKGVKHQHHGGMVGDDDDRQTYSDSQTIDLLMKGAKPKQPGDYLCSTYSITEEESYIYKVEALADKSSVHLILLYGCNGELIPAHDMGSCGNVCQDKIPTVLFSWTSATPDTASLLPPDVGLRIGSKTNIKNLILQVYYSKSFAEFEEGDHSGFKLYTTQQRLPYTAGVYTMMRTNFEIPPQLPAYYLDMSCKVEMTKTVYPIAFMTHSHKLGQVISGYQYNGSFHEVGRGNPQWPQAYYPMRTKIAIQPGDYVAARCTYNSMLMDQPTKSGFKASEEMCNFFILFYIDSSVPNPSGLCTSDAVPTVTGNNFPLSGSIPLPPNAELDRWVVGHNKGFLWEVNSLQGKKKKVNKYNKSLVKVNNAKHRLKPNKQKSRPSHLSNRTQLGQKKNLRRHRSDSQSNMLDYDVIDHSRHRRQAQEYYDEYAANDLREKGLYATATSSEEGLSRNRNKGFEAISQQVEQLPRKNTAGRQGQSQRLDPNQESRQPQEQSIPAPAHGQEKESRRLQNPNEAANLGQAPGDVPKSHSHVHLAKLVFNASWPEGTVSIGQIGGLATDKTGNVYVFHRGSRIWTGQSFNMDNDFQLQDSPIPEDVITVLNSAGRVINHFGSGQYFMPHGITVDQQGNIWLTDVALHQVFKIEIGKTEPSLTLGHRFQHGDSQDYFCKPTDVAVLSNGDFFVSDGYCNSRILKFSKDGKLITSWGKQNLRFGPTPPPVGTFDVPHGITVSEENQLVCVADRENGRIQCFDLEGNFKQVIKHQQFGPRLFALEYCPEHGGLLYAVNGPAFDGPSDFTVQGFTLDIKTGDLLEMWNVPEYMKNPHDVAVDPASHSIYVGELDPHRVWKFSRLTPTTISHNNLEESTQSSVLDSVSKQVEAVGMNETALSGSPGSKTISPSVIIGILLVVPVVLLLIIVLLVRAHQSGKLKCYGHGKKGKVFNLQGFNWNSHKGFDRLSTEESDHEIDPEDLDHKDYLAPQKTKNKA